MFILNHCYDEADGGCSEMEIPEQVEVVESKFAGSVAADSVEMNQSPAIMVAADSVNMHDSPAMIVLGDQVELQKSNAVIVIADEVHGEYSTVFTPKTAAIFGGAMGVAFFIMSKIFPPYRRR